MKMNNIYFEEKERFHPKKPLTKKPIGFIVKKVPRGLRNSKPAKT